jgi:hypothetical protein
MRLTPAAAKVSANWSATVTTPLLHINHAVSIRVVWLRTPGTSRKQIAIPDCSVSRVSGLFEQVNHHQYSSGSWGSAGPTVQEVHEQLVDGPRLLFLGKVPTLPYFGSL